jgi:hypothetical protein
MSADVRMLSRDLLIAWMKRETPPTDAPDICLARAKRHDAVNTANEAEEAKSFVPPAPQKDAK